MPSQKGAVGTVRKRRRKRRRREGKDEELEERRKRREEGSEPAASAITSDTALHLMLMTLRCLLGALNVTIEIL